jgi:hypothetical protein
MDNLWERNSLERTSFDAASFSLDGRWDYRVRKFRTVVGRERKKKERIIKFILILITLLFGSPIMSQLVPASYHDFYIEVIKNDVNCD